MSSAISQYITQIQNAVYGEQVRGAIVNALQACYSDVENPDLQSAAFLEAINTAYASGILDIVEVTQVSQMTNENIIYRYMGTETGYTANTLYYHNGTAWVPIGSGLRTASTAALMTDTGAIYKYTGTESGYQSGGLYYHNGTSWVLIASADSENISIRGLVNGVATSTYKSIDKARGSATNGLNPIPVKKGYVLGKRGDTDNAYSFQARIFVNGTVAIASQVTKNDWTIPQDGELVFSVYNGSSSALDPNVVENANSFMKIIAPSACNSYERFLLTEGNEQPDNLFPFSTSVSGYLDANGVLQPSTLNNDRCSQYIPVSQGDSFVFRVNHTVETPENPFIVYCFYDSSYSLVGSRGGGETYNQTDASGLSYAMFPINVTNASAAYMRISLRTYGGANFALYKGSKLWNYTPAQQDFAKYNLMPSPVSPVSAAFPFKGICHRGYRENGIAENTIPAYKAAKAHGFDIVETDIHESSDGVLFLWHDSTMTINGTTKSPTLFTWAEIQTLDLGSGDYAGTKIPTFEEFAKICQKLNLYPYCELKAMTLDGVQKVIDICKFYCILDKCTFPSASDSLLLAVSAIHPSARIGKVAQQMTKGVATSTLKLRNGVNEVFLFGSVFQEGVIDLARANNMPIEQWTLDSESAILAVSDYVSGVVSNTLNAANIIYNKFITLP